MPIPAILSYALGVAIYLKYPIIFLATTFGGPMLMLASGFLLHEGAFELVPIFLALALGELTWDAVWYCIGYFYADTFIARWGRYFSFTPQMFEKAKEIFAKYHAITLFGNKLLMGMGMGIAILITGGATKVSFWKYMLYNALGEIIWVSGMLYIGYFYAGLYAGVEKSARLIFLGGTIAVILLLIIGGSKYLRKKTLEN